MTRQLIVPVDGSRSSFTAFDTAMVLARRLGIGIRLVEAAFTPRDVSFRAPQLADELARRLDGTVDLEVTIEMPLSRTSVAAAIHEVVDRERGSMIVMASHGRGRSAAVVGSVAHDLLRRISDPIMLVGPKIAPNDFSGPVMASTDGSKISETALPVAAELAHRLGTTPWIVNVSEASDVLPADITEGGHLALLADDLRQQSGRAVEFDQLHGKRPALAMTKDARERDASMIVTSTIGRSGFQRAAMGSVAAGLVRHATCPVVAIRPRMAGASAHTCADDTRWLT